MTSMPPSSLETVYHVTVASNFARAFDKYSRRYDKARIAQSTFTDKFFLLRRDELPIGLDKATKLLAKTSQPGDRLLVLETCVSAAALKPNLVTGRGRYINGTAITLTSVYWVTSEGALEHTSFEDVMALSLKCLAGELPSYASLVPRTLSVLPIARACQASCNFCFSESSASLDQAAKLVDVDTVEQWMAPAIAAGAERFVITGGGEPGLVKHSSLVGLMATAARHFSKVVLITNGVHLARVEEQKRLSMLDNYAGAGLTVLAVSRHHDDAGQNAQIMGLDTGTERVLATLQAQRSRWPHLRTRLICVLQTVGIATRYDIWRYLQFAAQQGVDEVCFKELYVSTTLESAYHAQVENQWSRDHQVPLALLLDVMAERGFKQTGCLPWGAPLFEGVVDGRTIRVAAYTEPSVHWERSNGIARSWNLMADGACLASLEDLNSHIALPGTRPRKVIPLTKTA